MNTGLSLVQMRSFLAVAHHQNFRRAAAELHITQPALSGRVKALEKSLGVMLFLRTTRSVRLTTDGERFLLRARRLLDDAESAIGDIRDRGKIEHGTVAFSCIPTIAATVFPRIIRDFIKDHPAVRIDMTDDATVKMERRILSGEVEFGIGGSPRWSQELGFQRIVDDPLVLVCHAEHKLARRSRVRLDEVLTHEIISLSEGSNVKSSIAAYLASRGKAFSPTYELTHQIGRAHV